jgi:hypothetical protein
MKLFATTLPLLLLLAPAALAQDPEPDTTDAWRYLPFHLGNVWEYERWEDRDCSPTWPPICDPEPVGFLRREVVRDTVFNSEPAWIVRDSQFSTGGHPSYQTEWIVRFDTSAARAYEYRMSGQYWGYWPDAFPCRLDAPFWEDADCEGPGYAAIAVLPVFGESVAVKSFTSLMGTYAFVADIGLISSSGGEFVMAGMDIVYARVDGAEYGTRFPVASESVPEAAIPFDLTLHPNPLRDEGTLTLRLGRPERVVIVAFDVLGRRVATVHDGALPAGEHALPFDASRLPPGVYVVRSASASASSTTRVTVAR